jgi:signal transduction histidine kinase
VVYGLIFCIALVDALTPAGVVLGIFLGVPIVLASMFAERRHVLAAAIASVLCFLLAATLGQGPFAPHFIWLPNRIFVLAAILAFSWLALELQQRRQALERERAAAESARDLTRLLHSLMAHDLRAPLVLARQGFEMVRGAAEGNWPPNLALVDEVDARLTRSLRTIELVLDAARSEFTETPTDAATPPVAIAAELEEEIAGFRANAEARRKSLVVDVMPADLVLRVNAAVLRQSVAILVDNALCYSLPGTIHVLAQVHGSYLWVHVRDEGPGIAAADAPGQGSGIGLRLSRLLAQRAGGSLELLRNGAQGTEFVLRLPARPR